MTNLNLPELLAKAEAATGPDRELDLAIFMRFAEPEVFSPWIPTDQSNHFTASVDACLALAERMLPAGWEHALYSEDGRTTFKALLWLGENNRVDAYAKTLPLALCAAIIRAKLSPLQEIKGVGRG